jgi:hypothetical protein
MPVLHLIFKLKLAIGLKEIIEIETNSEFSILRNNSTGHNQFISGILNQDVS